MPEEGTLTCGALGMRGSVEPGIQAGVNHARRHREGAEEER
jgi:hypothetical protein